MARLTGEAEAIEQGYRPFAVAARLLASDDLPELFDRMIGIELLVSPSTAS